MMDKGQISQVIKCNSFPAIYCKNENFFTENLMFKVIKCQRNKCQSAITQLMLMHNKQCLLNVIPIDNYQIYS